jgi:hypothetical protein
MQQAKDFDQDLLIYESAEEGLSKQFEAGTEQHKRVNLLCFTQLCSCMADQRSADPTQQG